MRQKGHVVSTNTSLWVIIGDNGQSQHRAFTQRELCGELGYDILALMETHDTGSLRHSKQAPSASDTLAELETLLSKVNRHECVVFLGDSNAKLARRTDRMTCRWCIHRRANPAGDRLLGLMDRL